MVANKASPADAMWDIVRESQPESVPASNVHYVIDGCALTDRLPWPRHASRKYGYGRGNVGFDGYANGPTIKDVAHLRLPERWAVHFTEQTSMWLKKETFLANEGNKQRFLTC